jgi:hypothetical protein
LKKKLPPGTGPSLLCKGLAKMVAPLFEVTDQVAETRLVGDALCGKSASLKRFGRSLVLGRLLSQPRDSWNQDGRARSRTERSASASRSPIAFSELARHGLAWPGPCTRHASGRREMGGSYLEPTRRGEDVPRPRRRSSPNTAFSRGGSGHDRSGVEISVASSEKVNWGLRRASVASCNGLFSLALALQGRRSAAS